MASIVLGVGPAFLRSCIVYLTVFCNGCPLILLGAVTAMEITTELGRNREKIGEVHDKVRKGQYLYCTAVIYFDLKRFEHVQRSDPTSLVALRLSSITLYKIVPCHNAVQQYVPQSKSDGCDHFLQRERFRLR